MADAGIRHAFFTRAGGVSDGIYRGLNTGTGSADDPGKVAENRRRAAAWMGVAPDRLLSLHQVHSPDALVVEGPFPGPRPRADALVTNRPGLAISASAADCGPVLLADAAAGVIGAAHAGWKGALTGVLESTIAAMEGLGAERARIVAVLGPSISQPNYEVGPEFFNGLSITTRKTAPTFVIRAKPAIGCSTSTATRSTAWPVAAFAPAPFTAAPMPRRICSSRIGAPPIAASPIMAG